MELTSHENHPRHPPNHHPPGPALAGFVGFDAMNMHIRYKPFQTRLPGYSQPCLVRQLSRGETIRHGDWFTSLKPDGWHYAEAGCKVREFHLPHIRVIATGKPFFTQPLNT